VALSLGSSRVGCGDQRQLEEWGPEDHGHPPGARPAADGRAAPPGSATNADLSPEQREARAAASLWTVLCASCHGREGLGNGPGAPPGAQVANLTTAAWQSSRTDEQIAAVITQGQGLMPAFAERLNPRGIAALVGHVRRLGGRGPGGAPLPGSAVPDPGSTAPPGAPSPAEPGAGPPDDGAGDDGGPGTNGTLDPDRPDPAGE